MDENMERALPFTDDEIPSPVASSPFIFGSQVICYMTNIVIECVSDTADHPITAAMQINVELVRDPAQGGETILFEKIFPSEWGCDRIIQLTDEITFNASVDDMGHIGSVKLGNGEVERLKGSKLNEAVYEFVAGQDDSPKFRLHSEMVCFPLEGEYSEEDFAYTLEYDSESVFSMVQNLPDSVLNKPLFLDACQAHFWECVLENENKDDIDNCLLANRLMLPGQFDAAFYAHTFRLHRIGLLLLYRFSYTGDLTDISESISFLQEAVQHTPEGHPDRPCRLTDLGNSFKSRFLLVAELADLSKAISIQQEAVQLTPEGHPHMLSHLSTLVNSIWRRSLRTWADADVSNAIPFLQKVVQLTTEGHPDRPSYLVILGNALGHRFSRTGELADLSEAISLFRKAVQLTPEDHPNKPSYLFDLGSALSQFSSTGELADISEAILLQQNAVQLTPEGHPNKPRYLSALGNALGHRFSRTGELADLSESISYLQKAVQLTPEGHSNKPSYLSDLGNALSHQFSSTGELADISEAILLQQKAVQLTPEGHSNKPGYLSNLGHALCIRFSHTGEFADLSESISFLQNAVQLTPEGHPYKPIHLFTLGNALEHRFSRTGELADLSESISLLLNAIQLTPEGHSDKPRYLSDLGNALRHRFSRTGELADLSESISFLQNAIQLTPEGHPNKPRYLSILGSTVEDRFSRTGELTDISEAISLHQNTIQLTPEGHSNKPYYLSNLGRALCSRFSRTGEYADLSESISFLENAVEFTPEGHPNKPSYLSTLGNALEHRFLRTGELPDISEAILLQQKAVQLTPEGHLSIAKFLESLSSSFFSRFQKTQVITDINLAISKLTLSVNSVSGPPSFRLYAAKHWAKLCQEYDPPQLLDAHRAIIHLISRVASLEQTIETRHKALIEISSLSISAAAVALASGETELSLEWLEQGRCLVWSQLNELRTPLDDLQSYDPEIANELMKVSRALEIAGSRAENFIPIANINIMQRSSLQEEVAIRAKLAQRWDQLLERVRNIPDFEDFLRPPSASSLLKNIPNAGIVIVINVHQDRCDALALRSGVELLHIPLPEFSYNQAESLRNNLNTSLWAAGLRMRESKSNEPRGMRYEGQKASTSLQCILATLWSLVVKPILNALGYLEAPRDLMRIWWCLSGPLAFLPIHAAGIYNGSKPGVGSTLSDFAISSYTPTVRALVDRVKTPQEFKQGKAGLFMISQPDTPHLPRIPGTTDEVLRIEQKLMSLDIPNLRLERAAATVDRGIANMDAYSCIHFACHAEQNTQKPLKSGFSLYDGRLELSTVIQQRLVGADLAFLSACQTSAGDEKLSEEAVHLAAGMLAAGYRGVVATMWSIRDEYGPIVAEDFYSNLIQDSEYLSGKHAARALHYATQNLRRSLGDSELALLTWVPYVHFGL